MTETNVVNDGGTVELEFVNEEGGTDFTTGVRARFSAAGVDDARTAYGDTEAEALRRLADRLEKMFDDGEGVERVTITNDLIPVGIFEDRVDEYTSPLRDHEDLDVSKDTPPSITREDANENITD